MHNYAKVYQYILGKIQNGEFQEGDLIAKEMDLSEQFNVSRPTVRHALNDLVNEGYLTRVRGRGSFVTKPKVVQEYTKFIESYDQEMEKKGLSPLTKVLELSMIYPNEYIQGCLSITGEERVIKLRRLRFIKEADTAKPMILTTVYFPYSLVPKALQYDFEQRSFYSVLAENGVYVNKVRHFLEVRMLYGKTASLFDLPDNSPCHFISSTGYDSENHPIEYSENFYPADRNQFTVETVR